MEIMLVFNGRSNSNNLDNAIKIAENEKYEIVEKFYRVYYKEINEKLIKLLKLVQTWNGTELYINDEEVDFRQMLSVILCGYKDYCKGICKQIRFDCLRDLMGFSEQINSFNKTEEGVPIADEYVLHSFLKYKDVLKEIKNNEYILDKEKLKEKIRESYAYHFKYCPIINKEKIDKIIDNFPTKYIFLNREAKNKLEAELRSKMLNEKNFEGFTKYEEGIIRAKAKIFAEEIVKLLKKEIKLK